MRRPLLLFSVLPFLFALCAFAASAETKSEFAIVVNLPAFRLYLYRDGHPWRDYPLAAGRPETPTPTGTFRIVNKVQDPTWYPPGRKPVPPGPENPLGRWWFGLSAPGYGLHGCNDESAIGSAVSKGCLRLRNSDADELARYVGVGTEVRIVYDLFALEEDPEEGRIWLWVGRDLYGLFPSPLEEALAFLGRRASQPWDPEGMQILFADGLAPGWHEMPRPVTVSLRGERVGRAFLWEGEIWFKAAEAERMPGGPGSPAAGRRLVSLTELAGRAGQNVDWRYDPAARELAILPTRLRAGGHLYEGAVRIEEGRPMVSTRVLSALLGGAAEACETVEGAGWIPLAAIPRPWRAEWDPEAWEVVLSLATNLSADRQADQKTP